MRPSKPALASAFLLGAFLALLLELLASHGFPAFSHGTPHLAVPPLEADRELSLLLWGDRFPDLVAQAALMLLAATVSVSAMRIWRKR